MDNCPASKRNHLIVATEELTLPRSIELSALLIVTAMVSLSVASCMATPTPGMPAGDESRGTAEAKTHLGRPTASPAADSFGYTGPSGSVPSDTGVRVSTEVRAYPGEGTSPEPPASTFSLVYVDRIGLWAYDGTGEPRLLLEHDALADPLVSPNGQWIAVELLGPEGAYGTTVSEQLIVLPYEGGEPALAIEGSELPAPESAEMVLPNGSCIGDVVWRPDSSGLALSTTTCDTDPFGPSPQDDLWLVDLENGEIHLRLGMRKAEAIAYSPDGSKLAVVRPDIAPGRRALFVAEVEGVTETRLLGYPSVNTESEWRAVEEPVWMPDGSGIVLATITPDASGTAYWHGDTPVLVHFLYLDQRPAVKVEVPRDALHVESALDGSYGLNLDPALTRLAIMRPAVVPSASYPPPGRWSELVVVGVDESGIRLDPAEVHAVHADMSFLGWSPCEPTMLFRSGDAVYVKQHDVARGLKLAGSDEAREIRWAGCDHIVYRHGRLALERIGLEATFLFGSDVRAFHIVP